jgi:hypothetical protein
MDSFMRSYVSLLSLAALLLAGCGKQSDIDYGFSIDKVSVNRAYQALSVNLQQTLVLSQQAREALEHGVALTIMLELELRNDNNMIVKRRDVRRYQLSYLPLSERYQLSEEASDELKSFSRLRHMLAEIDVLNVQLSTGPLPPGSYELRTRTRLDESLLPAPMQLPAWLSSEWQHDSEWSVWPFKVSV